MILCGGRDPPVAEYRKIIEEAIGMNWSLFKKWEFYDAVASDDHILTIQTVDQALRPMFCSASRCTA